MVSSVTVQIGATVKETDADHHELRERGTAMIDGLILTTFNPWRQSMRTMAIGLTLLAAGLFALPATWAQTSPDKEHADLAKALKGINFSLQRGLTASAKEGKPISAKYEMDEGKLQLSVYTMKGEKFSEVIVDHKTGKVAKTEPITQGDDLTHAKAQSEAMAKAKRSLDAAASEAVRENKGYRVVSVTPELKDGHPVAEVSLVKGTDWKTVAEKLD